jgi:tol-pal system protein YbgF
MLQHKLSILSVGFLLFSTFANAEDYYSQNKNSAMERLEHLEQELNNLQQHIYKSKLANNKQLVANVNNTNADLDARIDTLEEKIRELTGKIEQVEFNNKRLAEMIEKISADNEFRFSELEKKQSAGNAQDATKHTSKDFSTRANENKPQPNKTNKDDNPSQILGTIPADKEASIKAEEESEENTTRNKYEAAFTLLKQSKIDSAQKAFKIFVEQNKDSAYTGQAYYWLGETYYVKKEYEQAALNFLHSYKKFPKSSKAPDSLLKLSLALNKSGRTKQACTMLKKLSAEYPGASQTVLKKAKEEAQKMNCSFSQGSQGN